MENTPRFAPNGDQPVNTTEDPAVLEEIVVEELSIDGICGVY